MLPKPTDGSVAALIPVASGAPGHGNRMTPCVPAPVLSAPVAGALPPAIAEDGGRIFPKEKRKHTTCNPSVNEALRLLAEHGYETHKPTKRETPVEIVALKGTEIVKIAVIRSRKPVQDGKNLRRLFPSRFREICGFAKPGQFRTMVWVVSPIVGWRYYWAEPGGIGRDWQFTKMMEE